jgi:hypothetical protein
LTIAPSNDNITSVVISVFQFLNEKMEFIDSITANNIQYPLVQNSNSFSSNAIFRLGMIYFTNGDLGSSGGSRLYFNTINLKSNSFEQVNLASQIQGPRYYGDISIKEGEVDKFEINTNNGSIIYDTGTGNVKEFYKAILGDRAIKKDSSITLDKHVIRFSGELQRIYQSDTTVLINKSDLFNPSSYSLESMVFSDSSLFVLRGNLNEASMTLYRFVNNKLVNETILSGRVARIETNSEIPEYVFIRTSKGVYSVNVRSFKKEYLGDLHAVYSRHKKFNSNKKLAFYDRKQLILSNGEDTFYLDLDSTKNYNFYESNNRIYAIKHAGYLGTISVFEDNEFNFIDSNVVINEAQMNSDNDKIYYLRAGQNGRKSFMSHSIKEGVENYGFKDGSNLLDSDLIDLYQENNLVVYDFKKDKLLWTSKNAEQRFYKSVTNFDEKLVLLDDSDNTFYVNSGGLRRVFKLDIDQEYFKFIKTTKGFFLKSEAYKNHKGFYSLMYFDVQTEDTTMIFSDSSVQFDASLVKGAELLLINRRFQNDTIPYNLLVWSPETKTLEVIENFLESNDFRFDERLEFDKSIITSSKNELRIYDFSNSSKPNPFTFYYNNFYRYNFSLIKVEGTSSYYYFTSSPEKGLELAFLAKDKVIMFDESTVGPIGLNLYSNGIVNSDDAIYVYNFTYKNGWQILKYDLKTEKKFPLALKEQNVNNSELIVFPNPFINFVKISGEIFDSFEVLNSIGQSVKKGSMVNNKIDLEDLSHGMYLLRLNTSDKERVIRILK